MVSDSDKQIIISWAKKFSVQELYLFGSCLEKDSEANDIDLAVRGISPEAFFDFYGKLLRSLSKSVDVVNLANKSRFTEAIERDGVKIYEQAV